jgi:hypothetical protein
MHRALEYFRASLKHRNGNRMRHRNGKNETLDRFPPRSPGKSNEWNACPKCDHRIRQRRPRKRSSPILERFADCIAFDGKGKVPRRMPKRKIRPKRRRPRCERKCKRRHSEIECVADPPAAESVKRTDCGDSIRESMNPRPRVRKWDRAPKRPCKTTDFARIARRSESRIPPTEVHPTQRKERSFRKPRPATSGKKNGDSRNAVNRPNRPLRKRSRRPSRKQRIIGCTMGNTNRSGNQANNSVCRPRPLSGGKHCNPERDARTDAHESKQSHGQGADSSGGLISRSAARIRSSSRKSFGRAAARFARMRPSIVNMGIRRSRWMVRHALDRADRNSAKIAPLSHGNNSRVRATKTLLRRELHEHQRQRHVDAVPSSPRSRTIRIIQKRPKPSNASSPIP